MLAASISLASFADGYAPRDVHSTIWNGLFAPETPETVAMLRYGEDRPNFYNGQVELSIPVYTWKDNLFEIPVSLCYSYSGLKPGFTDSSVGLGWFLNAGGVVTREVRGIPDETWDVSFSDAFSCIESLYRSPGSSSGDPEVDIEEDPEVSPSGPSFLNLQPGNPYTGCSMRGFVVMYNRNFSVNALSESTCSSMFLYTGSLSNDFRLGMSLADDPLLHHCVETEPDIFHFSFMGRHGSFILQPNHKVLLLESSEPAGELDIEVHMPSQEQGNGSYILISTGDNVTYRFSAQTYSKPVDIINGSDGGDASDTWTSWKLTEINHPSGHKVTFCYDDAVICNYSAAKSRDHLTLNNGSGAHPVGNWQNPESYSENSLSRVEVHDKRLSCIQIEGRGEISFVYDNDGVLNRIEVKTTGGQDNGERVLRSVRLRHYRPQSSSGGRCSSISFLSSVEISGIGTYGFEYDSADDGHIFPEHTDIQSLYCTDWYGYFNSSNYSYAYSSSVSSLHQLSQSILSARSQHDLSRTRMGALTRIIYPTGGYSTFEYELNTYSRINGLSSLEDVQTHCTGGLRVKKVCAYDSDGTLLQRRRLSYEAESGSSSGVLLQPVGMEDIYFNYTLDNRYGTFQMHLTREACCPLLDVGFTPDSNVEYLRVIEEVDAGDASSECSLIEHIFHSCSPLVEASEGPGLEQVSQSSRFSEQMDGVFRICRFSGIAADWHMSGRLPLGGKEYLTREESSDSTASTLETLTGYSSYTLSSDDCRETSYCGYTMGCGEVCSHDYIQRIPYVRTVSCRRQETDGSVFEKKADVILNGLGQVASISEGGIGGDTVTTSYTYHPDSRSLITSVTESRNDAIVSKSEMNYICLNARRPDCLVPYQHRKYEVDESGSLSGESRVDLTFDCYDSWCNPGRVTDAAGQVTLWQWGYNGLHPISWSRGDGETTLEKTWTWIPMVGVASCTEPSGKVTEWMYDRNGRPVQKKVCGEIVSEAAYNIVTE